MANRRDSGRKRKGKTSIAKHCWPETYYADLKERYKASCFLNDFPKDLSIKEIGAALSSTGFSEPPAWLKSYSILSQGQKMRVDIAHALLLPQKLVVFDEFTSVIDREVAKIGSLAISRAIRQTSRKTVHCSFLSF